MSAFIDYEDAELRMRVPSYLKPKQGMRVFEPFGKGKENREIYIVGVDFFDDQGRIDRYYSGLASNEAGKVWEREGMTITLLQKGESIYVEDGIESLMRTCIFASQELLFAYRILFKSAGRYIHVSIGGRHDQAKFEETYKQIVSSIELKKEAAQSVPAKVRHFTGGLKRAEITRLRSALDVLPPELAYLRNPILAIAQQDQDMLSSGEADPTSIEKALRKKNAKSSAIGEVATTHADALRKWLNGLPDHNGPWAAPAWFVEGFLRGVTLFGDHGD